MNDNTDGVSAMSAELCTEAAAWQVWAGVLDKRPLWPPYQTRTEALAASAQIKSVTEVRPLFSGQAAPPQVLPRLPTPRLLASGTLAGKRIELHGWHTDDIEIWERQHGLKFSA